MTSIVKLKRMEPKTSNVKMKGFRARKINRKDEQRKKDGW